MNPTLRVSDLEASVRYYTETLGFKKLWGSPYLACVARGKAHLFLAQGDQGHAGGWVWIGVEGDVEEIEREYLASGARIRQRLTNFEWALEMQVMDLDGNVLRIGGEPRVGEAFGPWMDMRGVLWYPDGDGGWSKTAD